MATCIVIQRRSTTRQFVVQFIMVMFFFSCKAQTIRQPFFEQASGSPIALNCSPGNIIAGDLNNDGKSDLVVACGQTLTLMALLGDGNGQFRLVPTNQVTLAISPNELVMGDLNKDGNIDVVVASHDSYGVYILLGDGKGNLTVSSNSPVIMKNGSHPHTHGLDINDLNKDGNLDIVSANNEDNDVAVVLGNGRGEFTPAQGSPFPVNRSPYPLATADLNADGYSEIVASSIVQSNNPSKVLTVLWGTAHGGFRRSDIPVRTINTWFVAVGDVNKDNKPDIITTHGERSELTILLNDGKEQFTEVSGSPFNLGSNAWHIGLSDVNHDGNTDVIAAANTGIRIMLGDGTGHFTQDVRFPTGRGTWHLAISDFNGDGKADVVTSNLESNNVSVLLGK